MDDMVIPDKKKELLDAAQAEVEKVVEQYQEGLITDGERYNKVVDIWAGVADRVAEEMMDGIGKEIMTDPETGESSRRVELQPDLHHGRLRRARFDPADAPAGRHARSDGQALGRDHRDADHGELPRRSDRAAVLHLDARRA